MWFAALCLWPTPADAAERKPVILTLQDKTFLKLGRTEVSPQVGFVTNDPFLRRYLVTLGVARHVSEILAVEATGLFSPDLGEADHKPLTEQLLEMNQVTPDISRILLHGAVAVHMAPLHGKVAVGGRHIVRFDLYALFATGAVLTRDDLELMDRDDALAEGSETQIHPTLGAGGGMRVVLGGSTALRLEGRSLSYIEVIGGTTLEMKNNVAALGGVSWFFPRDL